MIDTTSENHAYILLKNINKNNKVNELIQTLQKHQDFVDSHTIDNSMNIYLQFKNIETVNQLLQEHKPFVEKNGIQIFQVNKLPLDLNQTSKIVLITFYKEKVPINIQIVCQLFSSFGKILKIVMFKKKNYQAFIEFNTAEEARNFKQNLHNRNFRGMFFLKIQFTQKKFLVVKEGNPLEYDFTQQVNYQQNNQQFHQPNFTLNFTQNQFNFSSSYFDNRSNVAYNNQNVKYNRSKRVIKVNYIPKQCEHLHIYNICSIYGRVSKVSIFHECSLALVHFVDEQESQLAQKNLNGIDFFGNTLKLDYQPRVSDCLFQNLKEDQQNTVNYTMDEQENQHDKIQYPSQVLLISNMPQQLQPIDLQNIFKIFSKIEKFESIGNNSAKFYFESLSDSIKIIALFQRLKLFNRKISLSFEDPVKKNRKSFSLNNLNNSNKCTDWNLFFEQFVQKQSYD